NYSSLLCRFPLIVLTSPHDFPVTAIEPIINHGGASVSTQHLHQSLRWLFGVAAVVTDVGHVLLVDLCLDDLSCSQNEIEASDLEVVTGIPAEVPQRREAVTREGRHLCFQVQNPSGTAISTLCYISRSNLLVVGFSDGYLSLLNMKTLKREYHSQLEGGRIPVYAVTFQEPENDPRNCCYLWAVQSTQESKRVTDILERVQWRTAEFIEGLARLSTERLRELGLFSVEKRREGARSVSIFSWQVNTYGQGRPSTYLGVFDINRWYHAQMPDSLRPEEFLHNCPYFALWSLDTVTSVTSPNLILDVLVHERSLSRGVPPSYPPPEQFFNPSTYNFDGTCLLNSGVVHMTCTGFQKEFCCFSCRCCVFVFEEQLEAVLSAAVQTSSLELLTGYIKHWTSEEQPSSAASLRFVLEWTWNKVIYTKDEFDQICVPLFDGSCNFIDPQTMQSLQHCQLLLSNLSTVLNCFLTEARELTEKALLMSLCKEVICSGECEGTVGEVIFSKKMHKQLGWKYNIDASYLDQGLICYPSSEDALIYFVQCIFWLFVVSNLVLYLWFKIARLNRLLDLVVRPVPSCSPAQNDSWQSPCLPSTSYVESSSLKSNIHGSSSQKKYSRASELNLLETPLVVKRAKVLVTSSSASGFAGFTPQSILRSSLRTTPLATPSASPGRSVTPPLRAKEPRISFREVNSNAKWTSGALSEHCHGLVEDDWSGSRDKASLFTVGNPEDDRAEMEESLESIPGDGLEKMDVSKENSNVSVKSDQTTLEYHDAKSPSDFEDDVIFIAAKPASSFTEESADFQEPEKENNEIIEDKLLQVEHTDSSELGKEAGVFHHTTSSFLINFSNVLEEVSGDSSEVCALTATSPCSELHPSGNLQYNYDTIEQQFAYDLPDNKDGECYAVEGDGELFISQSNFTLVLEGEEGEGEMGDLALADASKAAVTTTDEKPVNSLGSTENEEHVTNSVSTVTSDQESQNIAESLPYVPEPIKVAIAENLLDVIKDTRSKEFTSEVVEQSIHESIGKKVTRFRKSKTPLTAVSEGADDETSMHQVEYVVTPRTRARRQLSRTLIIPSAVDQQVLKTDQPVLFGLSPRRSTRQTKEASETASLVTVENTQDEQIPVIPATPRRRGRKPKQTNLEKVESSQSDGQMLSSSTQSIAVTPRRLRRAKEAASELLEDANEEMSLAEGTVIASTTSRRTRGGKSSAGDQETGQSSTDHRIKMAVSPSRSARKLKSSSSPLAKNTVMDQELQPSDQLLLPGPTKRGRRIKISSSDVSENSDLDLSKSSLPQAELKLPVTPRRSARKAAQNLSADVESVSAREDLPSGGEVEILDTPRRRTRKVAHAKSEKTDTIEKTPEQPNEQSTTPRTTVRSGFRGRKRQLQSILEENTREEVFPEGTDGSPLLLTDINTSGYDETSRTVTDRVRRNRSRKTSVHQELSVEENESFFFSPPVTKLTKKFKGRCDMFTCRI
uniref:AT-hook containing transcription factor 1 n=1 Tax=Pavo cristatus TaxID=9049 RepID=A0A8C9G9M7_PAVCR